MSETSTPAPAGRELVQEPVGEAAARLAARQRVERRRKLHADIVAYLVINAFLVGVWAVTGMGYFWPAWVIAAWGVLLLLAVWDVYVRRPVSDADVDAELHRRSP